MSTETLLLLILIALIVTALPAWPHSKSWGYGPTGFLTVFLVLVLIWAIAEGRPPFRRTVAEELRATGRDVADSIRRTVQ